MDPLHLGDLPDLVDVRIDPFNDDPLEAAAVADNAAVVLRLGAIGISVETAISIIADVPTWCLASIIRRQQRLYRVGLSQVGAAVGRRPCGRSISTVPSWFWHWWS